MEKSIKTLSFAVNDQDLATHLTFGEDEFIHTHSFYEIFYITEGQISHFCNNRQQTLEIGDAFILRPNDIHHFGRTGACTHRDIMIPIQKFKNACDYLDKNLFDKINFGAEPFHFKLTSHQIENSEETLTFIKYMSPDVEPFRPYIINSFLAHILGYIYFSDHIEESTYPKWLFTLLQKLVEPPFLKEGIPAVKREFNYNYIYVCRVFKKYLGMTLTDYINMKRLELSKLYLTTTKLKITEISEEVGFNYPYRFNQLFKEYNRCTPIEYRKKYYHPD
nr:helix-turn-helix domain-containing protein [Clostridia bacterium]